MPARRIGTGNEGDKRMKQGKVNRGVVPGLLPASPLLPAACSGSAPIQEETRHPTQGAIDTRLHTP